jgi:hypothetical protein
LDGCRIIRAIIPLRGEFSLLERETVRRNWTGVGYVFHWQYHRVVGGRDFVECVFQRQNGRAWTKMGCGRKRVARVYRIIGGWPCLDGC